MLNPFPSLLTYSFFAPTLLRLGVAILFFYLAYFHFKNRSMVKAELAPILSRGVAKVILPIYILLETLVALGLFFGFWTQVAALVGCIICIKILVVRRGLHALAPLSRSTYLLVALICFSLLLTGAGLYAFDIRV
jgi:uncharacterized membrane protein YphA (DoxX/SURF4 family)